MRGGGRPLVDGIPMPAAMKSMVVRDASQVEAIARRGGFRFLCDEDMPKAEIKALEEAYTQGGMPGDLQQQRQPRHAGRSMIVQTQPGARRGHPLSARPSGDQTGLHRGEIQLLPAQSYVPALFPLSRWEVKRALVYTYRAISGAEQNSTAHTPGRRWWTI